MAKNYKLKSGNYIKINKIEKGYQYYLYEENKRLIKKEKLEKCGFNDTEVLKEVLKILDIPIDIKYQEIDEEIE